MDPARDGPELVSTQISGVWPNLDIRDQMDIEVSGFYSGERPANQVWAFFLLWPICCSFCYHCCLSVITEIYSFICSCTLHPWYLPKLHTPKPLSFVRSSSCSTEFPNQGVFLSQAPKVFTLTLHFRRWRFRLASPAAGQSFHVGHQVYHHSRAVALSLS